MKALYNENPGTLIKEIIKGQKKKWISLAHRSEESISGKHLHHLKQTTESANYRFSAVPIRISMTLFPELEKALFILE